MMSDENHKQYFTPEKDEYSTQSGPDEYQYSPTESDADYRTTQGAKPAMPQRKSLSGLQIFGIVAGSIFLFMVLICGGMAYFVMSKLDQFANQAIVMMQPEIENEIEISNLPRDQKDALLTVVGDLGDAVSEGEIQIGIDFETGIELKSDPKIAIDIATATFKTATDQLDIPQDDKVKIKSQLDRLNQEANAGNITGKDIERMLKNIEGGPMHQVVGVWLFEKAYLKPSSLTDAEKADGLLQARRYMTIHAGDTDLPGELLLADKPYIEEKIDRETGTSSYGMKDRLNDEELRALIRDIAAYCDSQNAPKDVEFPSFGDAFEDVVDDVLGKTEAHKIESS